MQLSRAKADVGSDSRVEVEEKFLLNFGGACAI